MYLKLAFIILVWLFPMFLFVIPTSAQDIQYQVEELDRSITGGGIEIITNKIIFTVKKSDGSAYINQQVSFSVWIDVNFFSYISTPPTNDSGITSIIFQDVTRRNPDTGEISPIIFADLSYLSLQQGVQAPVGCCQTIYSGCGSIISNFPDEPIAICKESITENNTYTCNYGRMIDSSISNTGAWTNFTQPCESASPATVRPLICGEGNPNPVSINTGMGTTNGMTEAVFHDFKNCWWNQSAYGTKPWRVILPIISCPDNSISTCATVLGTVPVNILWVNGAHDKLVDAGLSSSFYPTTMAGIDGYTNWTSPDPSHAVPSWNSFVSIFHLRDVTGAPAPYKQNAIYFLPDCNFPNPPNCDHELTNSCFTGYSPFNQTICNMLDSIYKREAIGEAVWDSNYTCNQQTRECDVPIDSDYDGIPDTDDNCPIKPNGYLLGSCSPWSGSPGMVCQSDNDCTANCTGVMACNKNQEDTDYDGVGDVCDNCPNNCNTQQMDANGNGIGDLCDPNPGCGGCGNPACEQACS